MNLSKILITGADGFIGKNLCNSNLIYEKFDILIANILSNTLIQLSTTFRALAKEKIILSGVLDKQVPNVINAYSDWIILKQTKNLEGWNLLEGKF